jgi:phage tail-like protein
MSTSSTAGPAQHDRPPRGRRSLDGMPNPHPLGDELPSLFLPVLSREERAAVDELAAGTPFDELADVLDLSLEALGERVDAAFAKLGAATPKEAHDEARADDFLLRLCGALDEVLVPIFLALDNLDAYFDAETAPDDFLDLLAAWVGAESPLARSAVARRTLVRQAVPVLRWIGTLRGLEHVLTLYTGVEVEATDNGQSASSSDPRAPLEDVFDAAPPMVSVIVRGTTSSADRRFIAAVEAITRAWTPAHVITTVEVTG